MTSIKELADKILEDGKISKEEYQEFLQTIHADGTVDAEEKEQIDRIHQLIKEGKVEVET